MAVGQESLVADMLKNKLKQDELNVYSLTVIPGLKKNPPRELLLFL